METPHPYRQRVVGDSILREFRSDTRSDDLIWHQDKKDRRVSVIEGNGWKLQLEKGLPIPLIEGNTYSIPAKTWHRIVRGNGRLVIKIQERTENSMAIKLTESQLRRIVRQEILRETVGQASSAVYKNNRGMSVPVKVRELPPHHIGSVELFDSPSDAVRSLYSNQMGPESWTVYVDPQSGKYYAFGTYDTWGT